MKDVSMEQLGRKASTDYDYDTGLFLYM